MQNREIKFRAWDVIRKQMETQFEKHITAEDGREFSALAFRFHGSDGPSPEIITLASALHHPKRYKLMQFTGLHDKNGREIYEGDILKFKPMSGKGEERCAFIDWFSRDADYWLYLNLERTSFTGISNLFHGADVMAVVIGNTYETPELLKI
jgi:uncharacterized phage protein (TIGR01671 family)